MSIEAITTVLNKSKLKGSARLVMVIIAEHVNVDGWAWPSIGRIAEKAALSVRQAKRAINECVRSGELAVVRGGGRKICNRYAVTLNGDTGDTVSMRSKGDTEDTLSRSKTVTSMAEKGDTEDTLSRTKTVTPMAEKDDTEDTRTVRNRQTTGNAAARNKLLGLGVKEPKLSELLIKHPALTPAIVRALADRTAKAANPAGLLISLIENEAPGLIDQAEHKAKAAAKRTEAQKQARAEQAATRKRIEAEKARQLRTIGEMDAAELDRRVAAAIAANRVSGERWQKEVKHKGARAAAQENRCLRVAVLRV